VVRTLFKTIQYGVQSVRRLEEVLRKLSSMCFWIERPPEVDLDGTLVSDSSETQSSRIGFLVFISCHSFTIWLVLMGSINCLFCPETN
jgi:hypothetical protein